VLELTDPSHQLDQQKIGVNVIFGD
jgi:hypothetical protein